MRMTRGWVAPEARGVGGEACLEYTVTNSPGIESIVFLFRRNRCRRRKKPNKRKVAFYASKLTD